MQNRSSIGGSGWCRCRNAGIAQFNGDGGEPRPRDSARTFTDHPDPRRTRLEAQFQVQTVHGVVGAVVRPNVPVACIPRPVDSVKLERGCQSFPAPASFDPGEARVKTLAAPSTVTRSVSPIQSPVDWSQAIQQAAGLNPGLSSRCTSQWRKSRGRTGTVAGTSWYRRCSRLQRRCRQSGYRSIATRRLWIAVPALAGAVCSWFQFPDLN